MEQVENGHQDIVIMILRSCFDSGLDLENCIGIRVKMSFLRSAVKEESAIEIFCIDLDSAKFGTRICNN